MKMLQLISLCSTCILVIACNGENENINESANEESNPVEVIIGENQASLTVEDYQALTEQALDIFNEATPLYRPNRDDLLRWYVRYYIQKHEYNEPWTEDEIFEMAYARQQYESAWKEYAERQYGVVMTDEDIDSQASYNLEIYENSLPASIIGMSEGLNLTIEEFMLNFDRDYAERTLIWDELMPLLEKKYAAAEATRLDGVYLGKQYEQEVLNYMQSRHT
ncbi:hypothetical protein HXZ66_14970 [Bacillus sp. A116_S68]|nr:hypothetical protein HXZ66_14970 [Bacillus sp. A116_S68]